MARKGGREREREPERGLARMRALSLAMRASAAEAGHTPDVAIRSTHSGDAKRGRIGSWEVWSTIKGAEQVTSLKDASNTTRRGCKQVG